MIYGVFALAALLAVASLSVDWGRVSLTKSELQQAADSAARYAASSLPLGPTIVQANAAAAIADNKVEGAAIIFNPATDLEFGTWNASTKQFSVLTGVDRASANAVRVTVYRNAAHGSPVSLAFGKAINKQTIDVKATSIVTRGKPLTVDIAGDACPWLAGMPNSGSVAAEGGNNKSSKNPQQAPTAVTGLSIKPGSTLAFRQSGGQTSYTDAAKYGPDGNTDWIVSQTAANGINTTNAPLNCMVGIFLDDRQPDTYAKAAVGDFTSSASRDFTTLSPPLKQVFFIGDGMNSANVLQQFVVPPGATRFYMGIMDEKGWWWDNTGTLNTTMMDDHITMVK